MSDKYYRIWEGEGNYVSEYTDHDEATKIEELTSFSDATSEEWLLLIQSDLENANHHRELKVWDNISDILSGIISEEQLQQFLYKIITKEKHFA